MNKSKIYLVVLFLFWGIFCKPCFSTAQEVILDTTKNSLKSEIGARILNPSPERVPETERDSSVIITMKENILSIMLLSIMLIIIVFEFFIIRKQNLSESNAIKLIVITLIIFGTLFLVTAGYFQEQLAPAFGLLGTISGYLLGKNDTQTKENL
jgi:hypothetical protein